MEHVKPILIVGATGYLGTEICRQLAAENKNVKALIRSGSDPDKIKILKGWGIETVEGDLKDPASLDKALEGVGAVISTASSTISHTPEDSIETVDRKGQLNLVEAAGKAWVDKFIFISFPESDQKYPLQDAKREVEQRLIESNMNYTILRAGYFMEVWLGPHLGFDPANHKATIYGNGNNKVSWIAIRDVAAFAVASLHNHDAVNSIIEIGGPEAISPLEAVKIFEEATGQTFDLQYVPEEGLRTQKELSNDPLQQTFVSLMLNLSGGSVINMTDTLKLFPLKLQTVQEYARLMVPSSPILTEA